LRKIGTIQKIVDKTTNKTVYKLAGISSQLSAVAMVLSHLEQRRYAYDIENLYWGGQELGREKWWKQVERRAHESNAAMTEAVNQWFKDAYSEKFRTDKIRTIIGEILELTIHRWLDISLFYFTALFGKEMLPILQKRLEIRSGTSVSDEEAFQEWTSWWYGIDPKTTFWNPVGEHLALLALAVNAGYYSIQDLTSGLEEIYTRLQNESVLKGTVAGMPIYEVQLQDTRKLVGSKIGR
jgi:hypothetical protein